MKNVSVSFDWPSKSDYQVMCLVRSPDGNQFMLSKFGTRSRHADHQLSVHGVTVDPGPSRSVTIDQSVLVAGTVIAPLVYCPPTARGNFRDSPPTMTFGAHTLTCDAGYRCRTWAPGTLLDGEFTTLNLHAEPGSQRRPVFIDSTLTMDAGVLNTYL